MSFKVFITSYHLYFAWYNDGGRTLLLRILEIQYHTQWFYCQKKWRQRLPYCTLDNNLLFQVLKLVVFIQTHPLSLSPSDVNLSYNRPNLQPRLFLHLRIEHSGRVKLK